ncbi:MAG: hypothetical protein HOK98_06510 [Rhodospirillaceae bacterium]|jgi:hypothetical protein|nr:hypothetical protein [Rhodospirillaceae bacterium]
MSRKAFVFITLAMIVLAACTHRREWTTHDITIASIPSGARCSFERDGLTTRPNKSTPFDITLTNVASDITVRCGAYGYHQAVTTISTRFRGTINFVLTRDPQIQR